MSRIVAEDSISMRLHPGLEKVRLNFSTGDYETAAFAGMKEIEVRVRNLAGFESSIIGVDLMRQAFKPDGGPLADDEAHKGEQVAMMELFAGSIGSFKNPASHRTVSYDDPTEAAEIIYLADLLMRVLDRVEKRPSDS